MRNVCFVKQTLSQDSFFAILQNLCPCFCTLRWPWPYCLLYMLLKQNRKICWNVHKVGTFLSNGPALHSLMGLTHSHMYEYIFPFFKNSSTTLESDPTNVYCMIMRRGGGGCEPMFNSLHVLKKHFNFSRHVTLHNSFCQRDYVQSLDILWWGKRDSPESENLNLNPYTGRNKHFPYIFQPLI